MLFKKIFSTRSFKFYFIPALLLLLLSLYVSYNLYAQSDKTGLLKINSGEYAEPAVIDDTKLNVVQATPEGDVPFAELKKEIYVVFNHPLVPLATLESETKGVFEIKPAVKGKFRWYGSRICSFVPDGAWIPDTSYRVTIPKGLKSLNGKSLEKEYSFGFKIQVPELTVYCSPSQYGRIDYDESFELRFNFPVTIDELKNYLTITSSGKNISYSLSLVDRKSYYDSDEDDSAEEGKPVTASKYIKVTTDSRFGKDTEVAVRVKKGMRSDGNRSRLNVEKAFNYKTHGPQDVYVKEDALYFQETWDLEFVFDNEVDPDIAAKFIEFSPSAEFNGYPWGNTRNISLRNWSIKPGVEYAITIKPFPDVHGNSFESPQKFTVSIPDYYPDYSIDSSMNLLEAEAGHKIPVEVTNISSFTVDAGVFTISDIQKKLEGGYKYNIMKNVNLTRTTWNTGLGINQSARLGYDISPYLTGGKYGWIGLVFNARIYSSGKEEQIEKSTAQIIQSTNLGVSVKEDYWNIYAWVNTLSNGAAKKGVKVSVYDTKREIAGGVTDVNGYVKIRKIVPGMYGKSIFYAREGSDSTYLTSADNDVYMGSLASYSERAPEAVVSGQFLFDRKLYRPGDEVFFKCIMASRKEGVLSPLANSSVFVTIENSEGETVFEKTLQTSGNGGVWGSFKIPADASLGHYQVEVRRDKKNSYGINDTFQVEEFRPVSFTVGINGIRDARSGESLKLTVKGDYMFGAPMGRAPVNYSISRSRKSFEFERFPGYTFGDNLYWLNEETRAGTGYYLGGEGALNAAGKYEFSVNLKPLSTEENVSGPDAKYLLNDPYDITIEATVKDVDRKSVTRTEKFSVFPGSFLIGIRPDSTYQSYKNKFRFNVVALSNRGDAVSGKKADVRILKNSWNSVATKGPDGSIQTKNMLVKKVVYTKKITLSGKPEKIEFKPDSPGIYTLTVQGPSGGAYSRTGFYAFGDSYSSWNFGDDDSVTLIPDKASYNPGDEAKVLVQSPFSKCKAIITLERESVYWQKTIELDGSGTPVTVPIKKEYLPNVYLSVMLVRPRVKPDKDMSPQELSDFEKNDLGCPRFKAGITMLKVNTSSNIAKMEMATDKESYSPGEKIKIKINSEPNAEIALSVADRGVLDLINYSYSNPVSLFYSNWPLGVRIFHNMNFIIKQYRYSMKGANPGGGDDDGYGGEGSGGFDLKDEDGTRRDIRYTAFWKPDIKTDSKGYAEVEFKLPDNLTTFRIMAVVSAGKKYREYKKEFRVRKAMVVQKSVPRFIRTGDKLQLGAVVINQTGITADFKVSIEADLLDLDSTSKVVNLKPGEAKEVLFPVTLNTKKYAEINSAIVSAIRSGNTGIDRIIKVKGYLTAEPVNMAAFSKTGFGEKDVRDRLLYEFPVLEHPVEEAFTVSGFTEKSFSEMIIFPSEKEVFPQYGGLNIQLSSTVLVGLNSAFTFYKSNPYLCIEQRASAFLLSISAGKLLNEFSFRPPEGIGYDFANIEKLFLGEVKDFQNADGGFRFWKESMWKDEARSDPYLSAYITFVLSVAKSRGYSVDDQVIKGAVRYLKKYIREPEKDGYSYVLETISLINYTFCLAGEQDSSLSKVLFENRKSLSLRAKGFLVLSIAHQNRVKKFSDNREVKELFNVFKNNMENTTRKVSFRGETYGAYTRAFYSEGSTLGVILMCYMELDSSNPLIPGIVNYIISSREHNYWQSTQSIAMLALAVDRYHTLYEKPGSKEIVSRVLVNSKEAFSHTFGQGSLEVFNAGITYDRLYTFGSSGVQYPLEFKNDTGSGRIYYTASLVYQPVIPKVTPRDEGMEIRRVIYDLSTATEKNPDGKEVRGNLERGNIYLCKIFVVNPKPYFNAVIVDPLPSNVEIVNTSFETEKQSFAKKTTEGGRYGNDGYWWSYSKPVIEYRDDRIVIFEDYLSPGMHEYTYLIRPTVKGESHSPAASSKLMYEPEVFGRTGVVKVNVR
ncbi:MAG: hypothetical protein GXY14_10975 [Spirochaetes bacterium]|nr:hypothetical protein [Spirochaetota bacterium]